MPTTTSSSSSPSSCSASPVSLYSPLPSLVHSSPSSSSSSLASIPERANEHLAVLLPKHLWKPDAFTTRCDNLYCRVKFSFLERRHHCRKCGGIFCNVCSSRSTPLLDTSNLDFLHPPRNVPLSSFESPESPLVPSRVCDDCWDLIHGTSVRSELCHSPLPRTISSPLAIVNSPLSLSPVTSGGSSLSSSLTVASESHQTPAALLASAAPLARRAQSLRAASSTASLNSTRRTVLRASHLTLLPELERSYGELDAYPLRRSSVLCKATGGGRWEPKPEPVIIGYRPPIPGAKAQYEIDMEQQEREERTRRDNPIVKDGEFQYRFPREREQEAISVARSFTLATF